MERLLRILSHCVEPVLSAGVKEASEVIRLGL